MRFQSDLIIPGLETPRFSVVHSSDVSEHASRLRGWALRMEQFSAGRFDGCFAELRLDHVQLIRETTTQALMKQGAAWPGSIILSVPMRASGYGHSNGHVLSYPHPLMSDGGDLPGLLTPKHLEVVSLALDKGWLYGQFRAFGENELVDRLEGVGIRHLRIDATADEILVVQQVFRDVFHACEQQRSPFKFGRSRVELEGTVLRMLAEVLGLGQGTSLRDATSQKKVADRARDFALARRDDPPSVADLCRYVGVSRRNLQCCFQDAFGIAPSQFLRAVRLNAVRRELRALVASGQQVSIGDVAASWGFWHWSCFAGHYRAQFGELPSQTLQNAPVTSI